mgnify:CR=1 FL=1
MTDAAPAAVLDIDGPAAPPRSNGELVFAEPWESRAFGLAMALNAGGAIVPSPYALDARAAGLDIVTWTLERSGILADGDGGFYYQSINSALKNEGATLEALHVLAKDVGIRGIFSDWPATVTYYANCMGLK